MSGFFGVASKNDCVSDLFYGTDYHSHLGTMRGGMAVQNLLHFATTAWLAPSLDMDKSCSLYPAKKELGASAGARGGLRVR